MKRLPWIGLGLVIPFTFAGSLLAQPINVIAPPSATPLGRQHLATPVKNGPLAVSALYDTSAVLANQAHLAAAGTLSLTATSADKPTLGYVPLSPASSTPNVNPFVSTALAQLHAPSSLAPKAPATTALHSHGATPLLAASHYATPAATTSWRLGSHFTPSVGSSPAPSLPGSLTAGTSSGLGRGSIVGPGLSIPVMGVPEPSTYLLCGMVLVLGSYWCLRKRAKSYTPAADAVMRGAGEVLETKPA